jgi:hypothetical protein
MIKHTLQEWPGIAGPKRSSGGTKCSCSILNIIQAICCTLILIVVIINDVSWIPQLAH